MCRLIIFVYINQKAFDSHDPFIFFSKNRDQIVNIPFPTYLPTKSLLHSEAN